MNSEGPSDTTGVEQHKPDSPFNSREFWSPWFNNSHVENPVSLSAELLPHDELNRYRQAVRRMGEDILALNSQVAQLQAANIQLQNIVARHENLTDFHVEYSNLDGITKAEIMENYATLKLKMISQTNELNNYKQKIVQLQNEIIKKNDQEKYYLRLSEAHKNQQNLIQRLQEKTKKIYGLEDVCVKQEKVIECLQNKIENQITASKLCNEKLRQSSSLKLRNKQLAEECDKLRDQLNQELLSKSADQEKFELYDIIKENELKIAALEEQLISNSEEWKKEKADLMVELNEAKHGFVRGVEMTLPLVMESIHKGQRSTNIVEPRGCSRTAAHRQSRVGSNR
ncbi:coiled-coil domain-containing protein 33 [Octopus bimaculoides]|uniref:coiled-coil domain-containing protein 33 n=1 Tax=Octopus bimaculoides TaxID=37653 RepID=UPI00071E2374|nr:coiled-coil domain-containing protein 33 [Octopus bimaculoides]|eukprot:XP_014780917.1 PREDICTED: coiled-coil domain-containing protein 33-like [Octopus bimaculoides]